MVIRWKEKRKEPEFQEFEKWADEERMEDEGSKEEPVRAETEQEKDTINLRTVTEYKPLD